MKSGSTRRRSDRRAGSLTVELTAALALKLALLAGLWWLFFRPDPAAPPRPIAEVLLSSHPPGEPLPSAAGEPRNGR